MRTTTLVYLAPTLAVALGACTQAPNAEPVEQASSASSVCSETKQAATWDEMVSQPIVLPNIAGGVDLHAGVLLHEIEESLCTSTFLGDDGGSSSYAAWGPGEELMVGYDTASKAINYVQMNPGYFGRVWFASRPGGRFGDHSYSMGIGTPIQRDGVDFHLDWLSPPVVAEQATELFDAMMATFSPNEPADDVNCVLSGKCLLLPDGIDGANFGVRDLGFYIHVDSIVAAQPAPSTPAYFYAYPR